jgi:hypothetical protein
VAGDGRWRRLARPVWTAVAGTAAVALVHVRDPGQPGSYGLCPLLALTGLACPGCGGLRAVHALTHGDLGTAWVLNPAVVALLPVAVLAWAWWLVRSWRDAPPAGPALRHTLPWLGLTGMVLFAVLRNVPALQPHLAAFIT